MTASRLTDTNKRSPVAEAISNLDKSICETRATFSSLAERLDPVLEPCPPGDTKNQGLEPVDPVNIANRLDGLRGQVDGLTTWMHSVVSRLQI